MLENQLRSLNVQGDSWAVTNDKKFYQVYDILSSFSNKTNLPIKISSPNNIKISELQGDIFGKNC